MSDQDVTLGIICAVISTIGFGSFYVPVKWFNKGDGIYFQWVQSIGQLLVGVIVAFVTPQELHPIAMISGVCYSIGNSLTITIMNGVGLAIGYLLWNTVSCVSGWAITRFGWFGNPQQIPRTDWINWLGIVVVCIGGVIYAPINHIPTKVRPAPWSLDEKSLLASEPVSTRRRILCLVLTIFVGFLYGNFLTPINYIMANEENAIQNVCAYMLSYCLGSSITSTIIFFFYAIAKRNLPLVNPELTMPTIFSGIIYGIATLTFFLANQHLDQVVAYPILSKAPGIVVSLWAVFFFKEIQGRTNILQLYVGIFITIIGIAFISLSKIEF